MIREVAAGVWNLAPEDAGFYLIAGQEACLLFDSGFGERDLPALLAPLVGDKPLCLVNSHYHLDHAGGNRFFPAAYAHPLDFPGLRPYSNSLLPLHEGMAFQLGGRCLEVLECPGHTPGGIALLDRAHRLLFSGDMVATVPIWMQGADANLHQYMASMDKFLALSPFVDQVLGCHGPMPQSLSLCPRLKALAAEILAGGLPGQVRDLSGAGGPPGLIRLCEKDGVSMLRPL